MEEENENEAEEMTQADMITYICNMKKEELVEYLVENLGDEIEDAEKLRNDLSDEQIEEYKQLIIKALAENDIFKEKATIEKDDEANVTLTEEIPGSGSSPNTKQNINVNPLKVSTVVENSQTPKKEVEIITLDDDSSTHTVCDVPVEKIKDPCDLITITRNLDNFSVSGISDEDVEIVGKSPSPTLRKETSDKVSGDLVTEAPSSPQSASKKQEIEDYYSKIERWTEFCDKQIESTTTVDIPENQENFYTTLINSNDDDDHGSLDNISLPSGGKVDFTDPKKISDPAKAYEYCGAGLLGAKLRLATKEIKENNEEDCFLNVFAVIRGYERHNFQAKCNICNGELIADQINLGHHVHSTTHKKNLVETSLKLIGLEATIPPPPSSSPKVEINDESTSSVLSSSKDISHNSDSHNKKEETLKTSREIDEIKLKEIEKQKEYMDIPESASAMVLDDAVPSISKHATTVVLESNSKKSQKDSHGSNHSSHRSNSKVKSKSESDKKKKETRKSRSRTTREENKTTRMDSKSRPRSSSGNRKRSRHDSNSRKSPPPRIRSSSREKKQRRTPELILNDKRRESFRIDDRPSHSSVTKKSHKDEPVSTIQQSPEAKKLESAIFKEKLILQAHGKWTPELEQKWRLMEQEQKYLTRSFIKIEGDMEEKLQETPVYATEWQIFWERRYEQLVVDEDRSIAYADNYDYTKEWKVEWTRITQDIVQKRYDQKLHEVRLKFGMDLETLRNLNTTTCTPVPEINVYKPPPPQLMPPQLPTFYGPRYFLNPSYRPPPLIRPILKIPLLPPPPGVGPLPMRIPIPPMLMRPSPYQYPYGDGHIGTVPQGPWGPVYHSR